jgi:hypothetical protein
MSNIALVSHGFHGGAKAMSKTARGCSSQRGCESKQHPAILPWPSAFHLMRTGIGPSANRQLVLPDKWRTHLAIRLRNARISRA